MLQAYLYSLTTLLSYSLQSYMQLVTLVQCEICDRIFNQFLLRRTFPRLFRIAISAYIRSNFIRTFCHFRYIFRTFGYFADIYIDMPRTSACSDIFFFSSTVFTGKCGTRYGKRRNFRKHGCTTLQFPHICEVKQEHKWKISAIPRNFRTPQSRTFPKSPRIKPQSFSVNLFSTYRVYKYVLISIYHCEAIELLCTWYYRYVCVTSSPLNIFNGVVRFAFVNFSSKIIRNYGVGKIQISYNCNAVNLALPAREKHLHIACIGRKIVQSLQCVKAYLANATVKLHEFVFGTSHACRQIGSERKVVIKLKRTRMVKFIDSSNEKSFTLLANIRKLYKYKYTLYLLFTVRQLAEKYIEASRKLQPT